MEVYKMNGYLKEISVKFHLKIAHLETVTDGLENLVFVNLIYINHLV